MPRVQLAAKAGTVGLEAIEAGHSTADVAIITTTEKEIITLTLVTIPVGMRVLIQGWAQVLTGAGTVAITSRIRRGTSTAGPTIGDAVATEYAAGIIVDVTLGVIDRTTKEGESYVFTIDQDSATGNGSAVQSTLAAFPLGG